MLFQDQKEFFDKNGYLVIEDILDQQTVLDPVRFEYSQLLDGLIAGWMEAGQINRVPTDHDFFAKLNYCYQRGCDWFQPMDISLPGDVIHPDTPMHFGPAVFKLLTDKRLLDVVEDLIGPEITSNPIQHVRLKPPAKNLNKDEIRAHVTATDWHQDRGVAHDEADNTQMVTIWCAVTDATPENGCLQVIPKNRAQDLLPHCPKTQTAIADGFIDPDLAIPLPVKSGGIIIFHPLTPHASLENKTNNFRWSFDIRFNKTGQSTGRSHFPEFIARSRSRPQSELKDWQEWKRMWEDARSHLSHHPHIPIHRWVSSAPFCA